MKLSNINTSSNEALAVRANVLTELHESLNDLSPFAQALMALDSEASTTISDTTETSFKSIWRSIHDMGSVEGVLGIDDDGVAKVITLSTSSYMNVNKGNEIVDIYYIDASYGPETFTLGSQNDRYVNNDGSKGEYKVTTCDLSSPEILSDAEIDQFVLDYAHQIGSIDILTSLSNMAIAGPISYADVMSVLNSGSAFINPKLQGIVSQYATHINEENACAIVNLMISDYFNEARGYTEEEEVLKFNSLEYDFDSSCLLGWRQVSGLVGSAVAVVATIFAPIAGFVAYAIGGIVSGVSEFITNMDGSVPKVVPEAAHNIASLPVWQSTMPYSSLNWAHRFIQQTGRLTITTEFFKIFAWVADSNTINLEMYVLAQYDYNIVAQWRNGAQGTAPSGAIVGLRDRLNFSVNGDVRSFQTLTFPNSVDGAWLLPAVLGTQSVPSELETSDQLYSRLFNGLFLSSMYVLYSHNSSTTVVTQQTRSTSLPSGYTAKERLLWFVGAYLDVYAANFLESSMATWLVPGWFAALRDFAATLDWSTMLNRITGSYFDQTETKPSILRQDYGQVENIRTFLAPTITAKGSAQVIPPMSKYSLGQKLAIAAGIAAIVTVGSLIASKRLRSTQARHAQDQRVKVEEAYAMYKDDPTSANWTAFQRQVRKYNRWTSFNGASRISPDQWGMMNTTITTQTAAAGDAALAALLGTEAVDQALTTVVQEQLPGINADSKGIQTSVDALSVLITGPLV